MVYLFLICIHTIQQNSISVIHTLVSLRRKAWRRIHQQAQQHSLVDGHGTSSCWHSLVFQQCDPTVNISNLYVLHSLVTLHFLVFVYPYPTSAHESTAVLMYSFLPSFVCSLCIYINILICKLQISFWSY